MYGSPPGWLSGTNLTQWIAERDPGRHRVRLDLLSASDEPAYLEALTNAVLQQAGEEPINLCELFSNQVAIVSQVENPGGLAMYLHAPPEVLSLAVLRSTNLVEGCGWRLWTTLLHTDNPVRLFDPSPETMAFVMAEDAGKDTDGDGLCDILERHIYGTDPNHADGDGDGWSDGYEVFTAGTSPESMNDRDGDGVGDGFDPEPDTANTFIELTVTTNFPAWTWPGQSFTMTPALPTNAVQVTGIRLFQREQTSVNIQGKSYYWRRVEFHLEGGYIDIVDMLGEFLTGTAIPDAKTGIFTMTPIDDTSSLGSGTITWTYKVVLKVDFLPRAGKINYGFDPKETVRDDGPYPWASVDKDDTSDVPKIVIDPGAVANQVQLVVASGGSSADIDPKTFTVSSTDLTITGQGTAGNALIEARIGSSGPACDKLNIMALPKRGPVQVGIYRVSDSSSAGTAFPAGVPSDAEIINTLNDVFQQAHIEFESHTSSGAYDVQYDTTKLPYVSGYPGFTAGQDGKWEEGEQDAFFTASPSPWTAEIRVFLVRENGDTKWNSYPSPYDAYPVRGFISGSPIVHIIVFTAGTSGHTALAVAHEVGHRLGLAAHDDGGGHDAGPWPSGEESLMRSGQPTGSPSSPTFPVPGRWLRHEDWKKANDQAGGL